MGTLNTEGSQDQPILFTSTSNQSQNDWYGIRFVNSNSVLSNCIIEYAQRSISYIGGIHTVVECTLRESILGVVSGLEIESSRSTGIININNSLIQNNRKGISIGKSLRRLDNFIVTINESIIENSIESGLIFEGDVNANINDTIVRNNSEGIKVSRASGFTEIKLSLFSNNHTGINIGGAAVIISCTVSNNETGIIVNGETDFRFNTVQDNKVGIRLLNFNLDMGSQFHSNNIFNNTEYEIVNGGRDTSIFHEVYLGEPSISELKLNISNLTKIFDIEDDNTRGRVIINDWLTEPVDISNPPITPTPTSTLTPTPTSRPTSTPTLPPYTPTPSNNLLTIPLDWNSIPYFGAGLFDDQISVPSENREIMNNTLSVSAVSGQVATFMPLANTRFDVNSDTVTFSLDVKIFNSQGSISLAIIETDETGDFTGAFNIKTIPALLLIQNNSISISYEFIQPFNSFVPLIQIASSKESNSSLDVQFSNPKIVYQAK